MGRDELAEERRFTRAAIRLANLPDMIFPGKQSSLNAAKVGTQPEKKP
jgi:hypothetical protein